MKYKLWKKNLEVYINMFTMKKYTYNIIIKYYLQERIVSPKLLYDC